MQPTLTLAQNPDADALLSRDPLALLVGMLLDQQVPMEHAFSGPYMIATRLGRNRLDAHELADHDADDLARLFRGPPAVHRYPRAMAGRVQTLCRYLVDHYEGEAARLWADAETGSELLARLRALPGFGVQKAQIFLALLGKQLDVRPEGWRASAGSYGEDGSRRSVADVTDEGTLAEVREFKREAKRSSR